MPRIPGRTRIPSLLLRSLPSAGAALSDAPANAPGVDFLHAKLYTNRPGRWLEDEKDTADPANVVAGNEERNAEEYHATTVEAYRDPFTVPETGKPAEYSGKDAPMFISEFGRWWGEPLNENTINAMEIWVHNRSWATLLSGSAGPSTAWDSPYLLDPDAWPQLGPHYQAIADFVQKIDFIGSDFQVVYPKVSVNSDKFADYSFNPWKLAWTPPTDTNFGVNVPGLVSPSVFSARISPILGKTANWPTGQPANAPIFTVSCMNPGQANWTFKIRICEVPEGGLPQTIQLTVNGVAWDNDYPDVDRRPKTIAALPPGTTWECSWSIPVNTDNTPQSMETTIKVENITGGVGSHALWVGAIEDQADKHIAGYFFLKAVSPLRVYALQGSSTIVAWVHNRQFNIMDVEDPENPPEGLPITGATIYLDNLAPNTDWKAEWWHTSPCTAWETYQNLHVGADGILSLTQGTDMPSSITWDAALILTKTSP